MVSSFFTVCVKGVDVGAGVTGMFIIRVAVGKIGAGVVLWYGVSRPVGINVDVGKGVAWLQLLINNPAIVKKVIILRNIVPDYTQ
jgi:hypothetical protein